MIAFVGPSPKPITGQSLAFDIISGHYKKKKIVFYYGSTSRNVFSAFWGTLSVFFSFVFFLVIRGNIKTVYLTTSRTTLGSIRDMLFIITARIFSIKIINHLHGADFKTFRNTRNPIYRLILDYVYKKIDTSIVLLPKMKEQYNMYEKMNVVSISNCAFPLADLPKNNSDSLNVLYLSNIMYSKGILLVIEAVDNLIKSGVKIKLSIAGSTMGDEYKNQDEILSLFQGMIKNKSYIEYFGTVTGVDKDQLLIDSDIFVLPSFYKTEAQPISIIEAMLSGSAIITTKHNYLGEMINSSNGFIIEPRSAKEIEFSILELKKNKLKLETISNYNKKYAKEHYSLDKHVREISAVLDS